MLLILILVLVLRDLIHRRTTQSYDDPTSNKRYSTLINEYGLTPAPSKVNYLLVGLFGVTLFALYAIFLAFEVAHSYDNPSASIGVQSFSELSLPAVKFCAVNHTHLDAMNCYYANVSSNPGNLIPCTVATVQSAHFICYQPIVSDNYLVVQAGTVPVLQLILHVSFNAIVVGFQMLMELPNNTNSPNFNIEVSTQAGVNIMPNTLNDINIQYQKRVLLNGTGQDSPTLTASNSFNQIQLDANFSAIAVQLSITSFDVITISDVPMMTWRQFIFGLIATLGTLATVITIITKVLAMISKPFRKDKKEDLSSNLLSPHDWDH